MAVKTGVSLHWAGLDRKLAQAVKKLADKKPLLASVGEALVSGTLTRFEKEESPEGEAWDPSMRALAEGGKTLQDTGRLRQSIDYATAGDKVLVGSKTQATGGSNVKYAPIHQFGGKAGRNHSATIPARPFIGISRADLEEVQATIDDFVSGAFGGQ
ncbi:phage virion morphogenesis protein [Mailhella sp.]|uniref:phage virion morphogenesis protein n=1 Tax=Mailhella sp. TaxID=1981029 RepID=UPI0040640E48